MSPYSDTLSWFRANQSLLLLLNAACATKKQQIPIFGLTRSGLEPTIYRTEASTLNITPPMWFGYIEDRGEWTRLYSNTQLVSQLLVYFGTRPYLIHHWFPNNLFILVPGLTQSTTGFLIFCLFWYCDENAYGYLYSYEKDYKMFCFDWFLPSSCLFSCKRLLY